MFLDALTGDLTGVTTPKIVLLTFIMFRDAPNAL